MCTKNSPGRKTCSSLNDAGCMFYAEMCETFGERVSQHPSPWVAVDLATPMAKPKAASLREARITFEHVNSAGFTLGKNVSSKSDATQWRLHAIKGQDSVELKSTEGDEKIVTCAQLLDGYSIADANEGPTLSALSACSQASFCMRR